MREVLNYLDGHKTYVACAAFVCFHLLTAGKLLVLAPETFDAVNAALLGACGVALRLAVKKGEVPRD